MADNRAEAREHRRRAGTHTGHHVVCAALVRRLAVSQRTNDGDLVRNRRALGQVLRETFAANFCLHRAQRATVLLRREILRIPRLLVGRATR